MDTNRIEINPNKMMGKPVIKGTRITVESILEELAEGLTFDDLFEAYPRLTQTDILAALRFAAQTLKGESIYPISQAA